ncbi:hypothetical protein CONLIGDRAFT_638637 [Coniochaeta ligniaria NRRL 30616]|uniref:Uncharacterized protein n=1 Tax=Coniochaeta ligniaria NRRL 30616 TaxID=1408157 RepID=A0A1J7JLI6_9PEZI|nr:hypothetical protein CONLIGDRAFT_638637 [Coniochaeta ligniaria NRRL 30616]
MAPRNRSLKNCLPAAGFQYRGYFADKEVADLVLQAMTAAIGAEMTPSNADDLLVEIFHRACERINLLPRVGHYRFWPTIFHTVPWFKAEKDLGPNKFRLFVTYLVQARLRAMNNPAIAAMSQPLSQTATAIDGYIALLRSMGLNNYIPDPDNEKWDRTTYFFRPDMALPTAEQSKLRDDIKKAIAPVTPQPGTSQTVAPPSFAPQAASSSVFKPTGASDVDKFKKAFVWKPSFQKRKVTVSKALAKNNCRVLALQPTFYLFFFLCGLLRIHTKTYRLKTNHPKVSLLIHLSLQDDDDETTTAAAPSDMDGLTASLSGLAVGRPIRPIKDIKRLALAGKDDKPTRVPEDLWGLVESMKKVAVTTKVEEAVAEGGEEEEEEEEEEPEEMETEQQEEAVEEETEQMEEEEKGETETETEEKMEVDDPLAGEDIYGIDD